jgi:hypothetical protein
LPIRLRLVIAALVVLGIGGFVLAGVVGDDSSGDISISGNAAIDAIIPNRGAEVLQQQSVGIDLAAPYRLTKLIIAPTADPATGIDVSEQVQERTGLNLFLFTPGDGKLIAALSPDRNCVFASYVEVARPTDTLTVDWCFEVS